MEILGQGDDTQPVVGLADDSQSQEHEESVLPSIFHALLLPKFNSENTMILPQGAKIYSLSHNNKPLMILSVTKSGGLSDSTLLSFTKIILSSLNTSSNYKSKAQVLSLLKFLSKLCQQFEKLFTKSLLDFWVLRQVSHPTPSSSKTALLSLRFLLSFSPSSSPHFVSLLSLLLSQVGSGRMDRFSSQLLASSLSNDEIRRSVLNELLSCDGSLVGVSALLGIGGEKCLIENIEEELSAKYVREVIAVKKRVETGALKKIAKVLHHLSLASFEKTILPACLKAMLRAPEVAIEAIAFTLQGVGFDLSKYWKDFGKVFCANLRSQDEVTRSNAIFASKMLASKIKSEESFKLLVESYIDVLNGSEGKIAIAAHKISILEAINGMKEFSPISLSSTTTHFVVQNSLKAIDSEVHEGILVEHLSVLSTWSSPSSLLPSLIDYIPKGLSCLKGTPKTSFCALWLNILSSKNDLERAGTHILVHLEKLQPQLLQGTNLIDAACLASVLLKVQKEKVPAGLLAHIDRKFIAGISPSLAKHIATLALGFIGEEKTALSTLAALLTTAEYVARKNCQDQLYIYMKNFKLDIDVFLALIQVCEENTSEHTETINGENLNYLIRLSKEFYEKDLSRIGQCLIHISHSFQSKRLVWLYSLLKLGLSPPTILSSTWATFSKELESGKLDSRGLQILHTFTFTSPGPTLEAIVKGFRKAIEDTAFKQVTEREFVIFKTPKGELVDSSVLDLNEEGKNMKRESKAYSYKDQLEEIKLRKELQEKRKQMGKEVQLTAKQKEALKIQLEKEDTIRKSIATMEERIRNGFLLLETGLEGNREAFLSVLKDVVLILFELMSSLLSSSFALRLYYKIGAEVFNFNLSLGQEMMQMCFRLYNPIPLQKLNLKGLEGGWDTKPSPSSLSALLTKFNKIIKGNCSSSLLTFIYPLHKKAVYDFSKDQNVLTGIVDSFNFCVSQRTSSNDTTLQNLARSDFTRLLYHLIGTNEGRVQQVSVSVLYELSKSCGESGVVSEAELSSHLDSVDSHLTVTRDIAIRCLLIGYPNLSLIPEELRLRFEGKAYQATFDLAPVVAESALNLWNYHKLTPQYYLIPHILTGVLNSSFEIRSGASVAMGKLGESFSDKINEIVTLLVDNYEDYLALTPSVTDEFGRIIEEGIDVWEARHGIGLSLKQLTPSLTTSIAKDLMKWLVSRALFDRNQSVHIAMLSAALEVVQIHGKECMDTFPVLIEEYLNQKGDSVIFDRVRQACVVLMGCLARHIDPSDPRVRSIFNTLIDTLSTPSEKVQEAVANCLPALVPAVGSDVKIIIDSLISKIMDSEKYGERRGAAYGLAGLIKGLGILSLRHHNIMNLLADGMQDKKSFKRREGSLMALELLCDSLGRLFEPYIVHVLPHLLQCLGDSNPYVREATEATARVVMSRLSGHGVKLVLPALLSALDEDSWRTKCGSVDLLGRMAYCAPKQLSGCLPMIVPHIIEVLSDSHVKVQEAAAKALGIIGSVIRNPEIQSVVPALLSALQNPASSTSPCLSALLSTQFIHFVDPPSLALIMPVVQRAFSDRSTENRRMAAQIIGNMYSLTSSTDLAPYMESVMPGIRASLLDPVPEVRGVAAKALGSMAKGMGEKCYDELLPWLMKTLVSETNSVDRSGAAQGLAEVIGALGVDKLQRFMPEIIRKAESDDIAPHVRDGYMMMFIYMPSVFESDFVPYIGSIINPILKALADENEFVRETALRAGQRIVTGFADTAILLLLPELERGIFDENWRIRYSSIQLLGDLLYKISGVSGKMSTESAGDDDNFGTESSQAMIGNSLGTTRRNQVLAALYMGRSDVALMVRQAALHVWKVIVANTPKTLREILPTLFTLLIGCLASQSHDKRQVAARTLGDLVRKLGEKILPEIIPILERGLESENSAEREGVCIGLSEIMGSTSKDMILTYTDSIVPTLRRALCDSGPGVRAAAASTFSTLHTTIGSRALDEILPFMLRRLGDPREGEFALGGLGQIILIKSKAVMPYLVPQLIAPPTNTKALAVLSSVAGEVLSKHLHKILPPLITVIIESEGKENFDEERANCETVLLAVEDDYGVKLVIDELLACCKSESMEMKRAGILLLSAFCSKSEVEFKSQLSSLLRALILLMTNTDQAVLSHSADAIAALIKRVESEEQLNLLEDVRQAIRFAKSDLKTKTELPGLCLSKGIKPLLGIFREALLNGSAEVKEQAAIGMSEIINLSSPEALKPSVIHVTGPLIRILGDRYNSDVKVAVIDTICLLLPKVGPSLRAFLPQLQSTFQKALNDPQENVKAKAEFALSQLSYVQPIKK